MKVAVCLTTLLAVLVAQAAVAEASAINELVSITTDVKKLLTCVAKTVPTLVSKLVEIPVACFMTAMDSAPQGFLHLPGCILLTSRQALLDSYNDIRHCAAA